MPVLPPFTEAGVLPPGDYELTLEEIRQSHLVQNPDPMSYKHWDRPWRAKLVDSLEILVSELWRAGITGIYIDGSFVEDKNHPNDIDGYFDCDRYLLASGELKQRLNLMNKYKIWTWSQRVAVKGESKRQLPMWVKYRVELYPHYSQPSGITDEHGNMLEFPAAFRKSRRDHMQKGIIKLTRGVE